MITETWLAYAFESPVAIERVRRALARVEAHYGAQLAEPPPLRASLGETEGMALWRHDDPGSRWPAWAEGDGVVVAATAAPPGWARLVGEVDPAFAAVPLGRALAARPERLGELAPPFVLAVRERGPAGGGASGRLTIVNDFLGVGRIYEMRFAPPAAPGTPGFDAPGYVWSNRLGALPIFAGAEPEPDRRGWELFAAAGWFIGDATPIRGTSKVGPGTAITVRAGAGGAGAHVTRHPTGVAGELVTPHEVYFRGAVDEAARQATGLARDLARVFDEPATVDLSGGRDSRISAAAAVAAEIGCRFATGDQEPGEVEIARRLVEAAPRRLEHRITRPEADPDDDDLRERVRAIHLVHDGMRDPQDIRRPMSLPLPIEPMRPTMSGQGGEIAHGFYYPSPKKLAEVRDGGEAGLADRLEQAARQKHSAAHRDAYRAYRREVELALDAGRQRGLAGPSLLDYFYLLHRLPYRSGLGARSGRYSACATPAFVRAAFDLTPEQRLEGKLHLELIDRLVPQWTGVPFFEPNDAGPLPEILPARIWEKPGHAAAVDELVHEGRVWPELFRRREVRRMWSRARKGSGHQHWEGIFNRIVWRECFDEHVRELARSASAHPASDPSSPGGP
ncbi:MAG TPA: hypothetical protein VE727_06095 [Solirubrobacterales bacterium]|nr:hypothetical protein [Solirubrobacterales bacterium]